MAEEAVGDLQEYVDAALPMFDEYLAGASLPIPYRPLRAAQLFAQHLIISVSTGTLNEIEGQPWFAMLFAHVHKWYQHRYGAALSTESASASSVVQTLGGLFELKIPLTTTRKSDQEGHIWMVFPKECLPEENVLDWLVSPPNLKSFSSDEIVAATNEVRRVANRLRNARNSLTTATAVAGAEPAMAMFAHADQSAQLLRTNTSASRKLAVWELNFLCENVLKYRLKQLNLSVPKEHDLRKLSAEWPAFDLAKLSAEALAKMPSGKDAVKFRYGEGEVSLTRALEVYGAALQIFDEASAALDRQVSMANAEFLLKKPPWMGFL